MIGSRHPTAVKLLGSALMLGVALAGSPLPARGRSDGCAPAQTRRARRGQGAAPAAASSSRRRCTGLPQAAKPGVRVVLEHDHHDARWQDHRAADCHARAGGLPAERSAPQCSRHQPAIGAELRMIALPEWGSLGVFVAAALLLLVTPGPAVLYIVARSVDQGRAAGLVSALGVHAGTLVHIAAAAAGLSVLLAASATLFSLVKYLGAAYLVFLGVRRLLDRDAAWRARSDAGDPVAPGLPRRRHRQRAEPEDGAVLPGLPAAVRRSHSRSRRPTGAGPRARLRDARPRDRRALRRRRGLGEAVDPGGEPAVHDRPALGDRRHVHRPRRRRGVLRRAGGDERIGLVRATSPRAGPGLERLQRLLGRSNVDRRRGDRARPRTIVVSSGAEARAIMTRVHV